MSDYGRLLAMKTIISLSVIASIFVAGTFAVLTLHPQPAFACAGNGCH
jgi:hypothetical protein